MEETAAKTNGAARRTRGPPARGCGTSSSGTEPLVGHPTPQQADPKLLLPAFQPAVALR